MNDLRSFVCEKVDQLEEEMQEPILSNLKHTKELCLSELVVANSYISELKALHEEEKLVSVGFDSFSQKSFVTKKVVDDLGIDSARTNFLSIEDFGGSPSIHHMNLVRFLLCPIESESQEKLHVEAHVQNGSICSPFHQIDFDNDCCSHLKGLKLADPFPRRTSKIDVLLGGRYYFYLWKGKHCRSSCCGNGTLCHRHHVWMGFSWTLSHSTFESERKS